MLHNLIGPLDLSGRARGNRVPAQMLVEAAERARRVPLTVAGLMETMSTVQTLGRMHWLQTNSTLFWRTQWSRFDDQAFPCGFLAWAKQLIEVVLTHILPLGRVLLAIPLDTVESVLTTLETNGDGDNRVLSMAVGTGEGGIGQLDSAKVLLTDHPVARSALTFALDVRPIASGTCLRSGVGEPNLANTLGIGDIGERDASRRSDTSTTHSQNHLKSGFVIHAVNSQSTSIH